MSWICGVGAISAAGPGVPASARALRKGEPLFAPARGLSLVREAPQVAQIAGLREDAKSPRSRLLGAAALAEALGSANLSPELKAQTALVLAATAGGLPESEAALARLLADDDPNDKVWARHEVGALGHALARLAGLGGPVLTMASGALAGLQGLSVAQELLESGAARAVAVASTQVLSSLAVLASEPHHAPQGEGAAALVLTGERRAGGSAEPLAVLLSVRQGRDADQATRRAAQAARVQLDALAPSPNWEALFGDLGPAGPPLVLVLGAQRLAAAGGGVPFVVSAREARGAAAAVVGPA